MPTNYTAELYENKPVTFEQFLWGCARAFGALVSMRDDPRDAPISLHSEADSYAHRRIDELEKALTIVEAWSVEEAQAEADRTYDKLVEDCRQANEEREQLRVRYQVMLDQVQAWEPPTSEHQDLKRFMVDQLQNSLEHDCKPVNWLKDYQRPTGAEHKQDQLVSLRSALSYSKEGHRKRLENERRRIEWLQQLHAAVPLPETLQVRARS